MRSTVKHVDITIYDDESKFKEQIDIFWTELNKYEKKFRENLIKEEMRFNKLIDNFNSANNENSEKINKTKEEKKKNKNSFDKVYFYEPEKIKNKSPITFFNGEWGSGKTTFFQKVIEETINNKEMLEETNFKKIAVIDLWRYVSSENIIDLVLKDCLRIIFPKKIVRKKILNLWNRLFNNIEVGISFPIKILEIMITMNIDLEINKTKEKYKKSYKKITPTIFIFENLERLENKSLDVIKLLQRLSELPNLLIILPVCKNKIYSKFSNSSQGEHWLDKYSTLGIEFYFSQTYINYLESIQIDKKYIYDINSMFCGTKMEVRDLENHFKVDDHIKKLKYLLSISKYHGFHYIKYKIFETSNINTQRIKDLSEFIIDDLKYIENKINELKKNLFNIDDLNKLYHQWYQQKNSDFFWKIFNNKMIYSFLWFFDFEEDIHDWSYYWGSEQNAPINREHIRIEELSKNKYLLLKIILDYQNIKIFLIKVINEILNEINIELNLNIEIKENSNNFYLNEFEYLNSMIKDEIINNFVKLIKGIIVFINKNLSKITAFIKNIFVENNDFRTLIKYLKSNMRDNELIENIKNTIDEENEEFLNNLYNIKI